MLRSEASIAYKLRAAAKELGVTIDSAQLAEILRLDPLDTEPYCRRLLDYGG